MSSEGIPKWRDGFFLSLEGVAYSSICAVRVLRDRLFAAYFLLLLFIHISFIGHNVPYKKKHSIFMPHVQNTELCRERVQPRDEDTAVWTYEPKVKGGLVAVVALGEY